MYIYVDVALCRCRLTDNLPCSTSIKRKDGTKPDDVMYEHGYRIGFYDGPKVRERD